jgi:hypothetical protein
LAELAQIPPDVLQQMVADGRLPPEVIPMLAQAQGQQLPV